MAKVQRLWFGNDSYGRRVEVAESVNGSFFGRVWQYNGYQMAWDKWTKHTPSFNSDGCMEWGFNMLSEIKNPECRYRLPNN